MKACVALLFVLMLALACGSCKKWSQPQGVAVYFSPDGGCTEAVVDALAHATNSVYVQAYSFTSKAIAQALVEAARRKVKVEVILDRSQCTEKYSSADFLRDSGIPTYIDSQHAIAHNKVIILDEGTVLTGSFNFTKAAEQNNAENLLVLSDAVLAKQYLNNWEAHADHSAVYQTKLKSATEQHRARNNRR